MEDRVEGISIPRLSGSHDWQHIKEQLNLLDLADITRTDSEYIWLNPEREKAINIFVNELMEPYFEVNRFNFTSKSGIDSFYSEWGRYYGSLDMELLKASSSPKVILNSGGMKAHGAIVQKTDYIHPPKTVISVHF